MSSDGCTHERGHIIDSRFFGAGYGTDASRRIFCDVCRFQRWLDVEAALALSQAELGMIPQDAATTIASAAHVRGLDLERVRAEIATTGHSLVGLLNALQHACPGDAGQYVHMGVTTQDIEDTGQCLEMRDVLDEIDVLLQPLVADLADLAEDHATDVALGRTHAQPALPMGFGLKVAGWVDELLRDVERLNQVRSRSLAVQLFGGVGTMAGFGGHGRRLIDVFARRLGLEVPTTGWHTARDRVAEYVCALALTTGTLGRIADELRTLSRPEFGEVELPWRHGTVGSSTMPHKRNPEACEQVVALARLAAAQIAPALAAMAGDHERDGRALRLEWACVPDVSHYCLAALSLLREVVSGLTVHPDRLAANIRAVSDEVCTERLMLLLAEAMGKPSAYAWVYDRSQHARSHGRGLKAELLCDGDILRYLTAQQLHDIFEPAGYLGESASLVAEVVTTARQWLKEKERAAWKPA
ncbi:adenylosuccinate lyase [Streptomyces viridochromogenes]|uniref:Adenylosuccinate lyase n=1 Tax=Streptomyces viridochromogenes TaxID=1938 RepID=A0A0J8CG66_STRVR|nr:adenylosuccinate lyase family protein [Streptomyces viridochromogenes]KMS76995.1 adenylosuccinate lyase [Streptomyces viridochromogenes]